MKDIGLLIEEITRKGFDEDTRSAKEIIEKYVKETEEFLEKNNREDFDLKYQRLYHMVKFFTIFIKSEDFKMTKM